MKAISIRQPWASLIAAGRKTVEVRTWATSHRGDLLIVSSRRPDFAGLPLGQAIAVARLVDCRPMRREDAEAACCDWREGSYAWVLEGARRIQAFEVKGRLKLFEVATRVRYFRGNGQTGRLTRARSSRRHA